MKTVKFLDTVSEYNVIADQPTLHPLVSVIDFSNSTPKQKDTQVSSLQFGFYLVFFKNDQSCRIRYGRRQYDYQEGTLIFIAPGQVVSIEEDPEYYQPSGHALLFHPDLIRGTAIGQHIKDYTFFSYDVNEALHVSEVERQVVLDCFSKINIELHRPIDRYSKKLIASTIELLLDYCMRFYDRQFITRQHVNTGIIAKFENVLDAYFQSEQLTASGLPTVSYCAQRLNVSTKYFGDLIKKETGKTAIEFIQLRLIDEAKEKMFDPDKSVNEVAYELGFKYPQHFTRFFKQKVGITPSEFRMMN
ncbi:helix-turn-helix domain-containing protein [Dyadobacter psychrophilus]|uniref:AraC-like ligand binding domain-containing protein n=1 Tax=Dyadobacter psychrophilus TaxID=651661 RepID=A0A1T5ERJ8_9BACT|nr:helix-turn-helix domain-containing protein [Dyadobacter psychrophilus]SKB86429.1 AraC-like ligand binding domain-containing protein [Dyadobacter psychrophilus]